MLVLSRSLGVYLGSPAPPATATHFHQVDLLALNPKTGIVETLATCEPSQGKLYSQPLLDVFAGEAWIILQFEGTETGALFAKYKY